MMQPYPEPQQAWHNPEAEEHMQLVDNIVRAVRKLRSDYGLQRQRPQLFIQVTTAAVWHGLSMSPCFGVFDLDSEACFCLTGWS